MAWNDWLALIVLLCLMAWLLFNLVNNKKPLVIRDYTSAINLSDSPEELRDAIRQKYAPSPHASMAITDVSFGEGIAKAHAEAKNAFALGQGYAETTPQEYGYVDLHRLAETSETLQGLGFQRLSDLALTSDGKIEPLGFVRIFKHERELCVGEITSLKALRNGELAISIISWMEDGWSLETTSRHASWADYIHRHPKLLRMYLPGQEARVLLEAHWVTRSQVIARRALTLCDARTPPLPEYLARSESERQLRKGIWDRLDLDKEFRKAIVQFHGGKWEWLGEE